jgi:hypothetical protein
MESIRVHDIRNKESAAPVKDFIKKLATLSFDADGVYESKDWPYLWRKTDTARSTDNALPTEEELARKKARTKQIVRICGWGTVSVAMYLVTFINQAAITRYFTRGGYFALAVVGTALVFALVHGTFASHILENLNFRAANRRKEDE